MSDLRALSAMHYWPASNEGLPPIACGAEGGFRSSDRSKVTCPACRRAVGPLDDRRQRAAEAFDDEWSGTNDMFGTGGWAERLLAARTAGIETATRVRIDHEIMSRVFPLIEGKLGLRDAEQIIEAAFIAAGFEVVE